MGLLVIAALAVLVPGVVHAHDISSTGETGGRESAVWVELLLALTAVLYGAGIWRLRGRSGDRRPVNRPEVAAFAAGWIALALALLSPVDTLSGELFSIHMIQHEVLLLVAAPLLVLGKPLAIFLWAFPQSVRAALARTSRARWTSRAWRFLTLPLAAWLWHAAGLWAWHAPAFFQAALLDTTIHNFQHATFLVTALIFWTALLQARGGAQRGAGIVYLFTTTVHSSVLGALLTFASQPWYPIYERTAHHWGLTALEDQQLGGLIMWVPASLVYVGMGLYLFAQWIGSDEPARAHAGGRRR